MLNTELVDYSIRMGLAVNCSIRENSIFARKNYFYPDLPKAYQISQFDLPICKKGYLDIEVDGVKKRIGITRAHLEEDAGKLVPQGTISSTPFSLVDLNRSGVPLLEIVSEPDIRSAQEAYAYLTSLKKILQYLNVSDCNMEEGSLRAEANISIRPVGTSAFGTKTEVKNVASFSGTFKAIEFEVARQRQVIEGGGVVVQETRGWDADRGITVSQRSKESAHDYRYFPEPDLTPIAVDDAWIERVRTSLPELPAARYERFRTEYGLSEYDAAGLTSSSAVADYFESAVSDGAAAKQAANWIMGDLQALLSEAKRSIENCPISAADLAAMIGLIEKGTISGKIAKDLLPEMFTSGRNAQSLVEEKGLVQISDTDALEKAVQEVIAANPGPVADFRGGKNQAFGFLMGQVMKATKGKGNPKLLNDILKQQLG